MYSNKKNFSDLDAMVFAAGRGKRMRFMTKFVAKPLVRIKNVSLLETNIKKLSSRGIKKIVINSSYKHLTVKKSIKKLKFKYKLPKIFLTYEKIRLETGGGLKNAISYFKGSKLLVINGDSLLNNSVRLCPIKSLYSNFDKKYMDVILLLAKKKYTLGYKGHGDYKKLKCSNLSKLTSKESSYNEKYIFTGWQIINKDFIDNFTEKQFTLKKVYDVAEKQGRLYGITYEDLFFHIGDVKSYTKLCKLVKEKKVNIS